MGKDLKTGRYVGKPKIIKACKTCSATFLSYELTKRKYCSRICYDRTLLKNPNDELYVSHKIRYARYVKNNPHKFAKPCIDCGVLKSKRGVRCNPCVGKMNSGENHYSWKGGLENKLKHNRQRALKIKIEGQHTPTEWEALKMKFRYMCLCCKKTEPGISLSRDHIIPLSKGGSDSIENIQPLCRSCNSRKYNRIINYIELSKEIMTGTNL